MYALSMRPLLPSYIAFFEHVISIPPNLESSPLSEHMPQTVLPGDPRTLGYGTDQGRWLEEYRRSQTTAAAAPNPFRSADRQRRKSA